MKVSRRDYFAGLAMQEILRSQISKQMNMTKEAFETHIVNQSFELADAMCKNENEVIEVLHGLVSDVGNLLCDIADLDFEWQQAGYYETAKVLLKELRSN